MLRRCMEGNRKFGMVLPRRMFAHAYEEEVSDMEYVSLDEDSEDRRRPPHFAQYGTMLEVLSMNLLPDGRSLIETIGRERFKIREWSIKDGYVVARTSSLPDIERTVYVPPPGIDTGYLRCPVLVNVAPETLTTNELIYLTRTFVQSLRNSPRLSHRLRDDELVAQLERLDSGGDPVVFAFWVGINMPMHEVEGYRMFKQSTVREVYFLVCSWIREMERQNWYGPR
jgi:ATP-dependent protease La (LON) substrate-binding domain